MNLAVSYVFGRVIGGDDWRRTKSDTPVAKSRGWVLLGNLSARSRAPHALPASSAPMTWRVSVLYARLCARGYDSRHRQADPRGPGEVCEFASQDSWLCACGQQPEVFRGSWVVRNAVSSRLGHHPF